jgi:predicted phage-related endonuclease
MLIPMPATREEWLALREPRVGASQVAALFGVQADYQMSHYTLHHVKAGHAKAPEVGGKRVEWGLRLQEVIAAAVAEERGWTVAPGQFAICDDCPGLAASLDFEIASDPSGEYDGPGALETKNVDWLVHRRSWTNDEPPLPILIQLQAQLAATGWKWGAVGALVGGNEVVSYLYPAKPKLIADIKARVTKFWEDVRAGRPPDIDGSDGASYVLREMYPEPVDDAVDMSTNNEWPEAVAAFLYASQAKKDATAEYDLAKNRVALLLGDHKRGFGAGFSVNAVIVADNPGRPAKPGEIVGKRAGSRRYNAKEMTK